MSRAHMEAAIEMLKQGLAQDESGLPTWMLTAKGEIGVSEISGPEHNKRVLEYLATCSKSKGGNLGSWGANRDETPWCSAFVNFCVLRSGVEGTRHATARSWLEWGKSCEARPGAIVVLSRDGGGHVGFFDHANMGKIFILGGNQNDEVSIRGYDSSRLLDYRWPSKSVA